MTLKSQLLRKINKADRHNNAHRRRSQRGAHFVLMFERQRVTQKVRNVG
ncbi:hypothetical protein [Microbulbifer sp. JTAC008]